MKKLLTATQINAFQKTVYDHYKKSGRTLPWRTQKNPYRIFISEVMLQQTQVDRVIEKYKLFIHELPDFKTLAGAPLHQVLALWQGLGYNRRALALKRAAEIVVSEWKGKLPASPEALVTLPGIGKATAASIAAFGFNTPTVFLETNIRTVLIHHFFKDHEQVSDDQLQHIAKAVLDTKNPYAWYSALMDYGTSLKKEFGNVSRKSSHYKKQSKFEGSPRQLRGRIVKLLIAKKMLSVPQIAERLDVASAILIEILAQLVKDQIIIKQNGRYTV